MAALGMIAAPAKPEKKQLLFGVKSRFEVNPSVGGYLRSNFASSGDLGRRIEKGEKLGEMVDIHSLEVVEELCASVTGYLFFSRYSGVVDAGTKAFALAEEASSKWL
jgi:predicted deacylase